MDFQPILALVQRTVEGLNRRGLFKVYGGAAVIQCAGGALLLAREPVIAGDVLHEEFPVAAVPSLMNSTPSPYKPEKPVSDDAMSGTFPLPSMSANSCRPETVISTTRGTSALQSRGLLLVSADVLRQNLRRRPLPRFLLIGRFADPVLHGAGFFVADPFDHFRVGGQFRADGDGPGSRVGRRIGERHLDIEIAEVAAAVAFGHAQRFGVGMAIVIEPGAVIESETLHDQRVAVPMARPSIPSSSDWGRFPVRGRRGKSGDR